EALPAEVHIGADGSSVVVGPGAPARPVASPPPLPRAAAARARTPARLPWIAAALPTAALATLAVLVLLHRAPAPAAPPAPAGVATVEIALDSIPQGALVTADAVASGAAPRRLGETPLLLHLPRGEAAVALTLTKPGFVPLAFKVVPNRD